jgi:hypothetical protein
MKNSMTQFEIKPDTFRFVAQYLNHCAIAVPCNLKYRNILHNANDNWGQLATSSWNSIKFCSSYVDFRRGKNGVQRAVSVWQLSVSVEAHPHIFVCTEPEGLSESTAELSSRCKPRHECLPTSGEWTYKAGIYLFLSMLLLLFKLVLGKAEVMSDICTTF